MSEFNITPEKVELENGDIEIVRLNNNLIFRDNAQGITLTIDQDTELSQLWNAFDSQIDTSQFFQENASGLAELLSGYAGLDLAGEDIENANVVNASTGEFGSVNTDGLSGGVAGSGNTISSLAGDSGEYHVVGSFYANQSGQTFSTTSTTFARVDGLTASLAPPDLFLSTNIDDSDIYCYLDCRATISNATATVRFERTPDSEVSITNDARSVSTPIVPFNGFTSAARVELKTDDANEAAQVSRVTVYYLAKIQ